MTARRHRRVGGDRFIGQLNIGCDGVIAANVDVKATVDALIDDRVPLTN